VKYKYEICTLQQILYVVVVYHRFNIFENKIILKKLVINYISDLKDKNINLMKLPKHNTKTLKLTLLFCLKTIEILFNIETKR